MTQGRNKPLVFYQIKRIFNEYPTAIIEIISEFYSWNSHTIKEIPVLNWEKISCNENIHWNYNFFNQFRDKLNGDLLSQNKGFLSSPDFITIFKTNCDFFNLNLIILNIGNPNIRSFFKEISRLNKTIDYSLVNKNWTVCKSNRLKLFLNDYIPSDKFKLEIKTNSINVSEKSNLITKENTQEHNFTIKSVILTRINNYSKNKIDVGTIVCDDIIDLHNYLINHPIDFIEFRGEIFELTKDEINYLNNIPLSNEIFIRLVDLNEGFYNYFKYNKYLQWDQELFEQFDDLYSWWHVGELPGNYLTEAFLIKNVAKIVLTQEIFEKIEWTMPLIYTLGWEQQFHNLFKGISPEYNEYEQNRDFFYINLDIGNLSNDVLIHYYPLLYKNYIESNLPLDLEVILTDLNKLKKLDYRFKAEDSDYYYYKESYRNIFSKKLGHLIVTELTTEQLRLILANCSEIIHMYYKLPRVKQFYCTSETIAQNYIRFNSNEDLNDQFFPNLIKAFRNERIEPVFNPIFLKESEISILLNSEIVYFSNTTFASLEFLNLFKNLQYLFLFNCTILETTKHNYVSTKCLYLRRCTLSSINFIYSFQNLTELYFTSNTVQTENNMENNNQFKFLNTLYLENHRLSEINLDNRMLTKVGIGDFDYRELMSDIKVIEKIDSILSLTIKWVYDFRSREILEEEISTLNIFKFNSNQELSSILENLNPNINSLTLVNILLETVCVAAILKKDCNVAVHYNYMPWIYELYNGIAQYKYYSELLFDSNIYTLEEYKFILENKRYSDSIHDLLYDEDQYY